MKKGDIILVPFPFTDLTGAKNRPALVLFSNNLDITLSFISTQLKWEEKTDVLLNPSQENGLKKESLLRLSKIATIERSLVLGKLGELNSFDLKKVDKNLKNLFDI
ncbi:type II toxin-antitoxin system PemK/MazF family toxin [Gracilimonas sp.]|uniref:type II toxin-antitoxin system PemK/MazF family toxin n=1 Tax=Gracilimonas sp. TaxID=1974203 RepID=UPI0028728FD8|nr:type II toxin-antitoxin system PemK/MazF family toxin [Gracilimonas sp.]